MNKYLLFMILPLLSFVMTGCNHDEDAGPKDLSLLAGNWEVVAQGDQNVFKREDILNITSAQINEGYGGYQGYITTYFLTATGITIHDRVFTWSVRETENHQPLLDVALQGELDNEDPWAGNYYYKITKLTDAHMWWQVNTNGDNSTIMFKRRDDIHTSTSPDRW